MEGTWQKLCFKTVQYMKCENYYVLLSLFILANAPTQPAATGKVYEIALYQIG